MKKSSVQVFPAPGGWAVESKIGGQSTKLYRSKVEAVIAARKAASGSNVVVRTSSGTILRSPQVLPSRDADLMWEAVVQAVRRKEEDSSR